MGKGCLSLLLAVAHGQPQPPPWLPHGAPGGGAPHPGFAHGDTPPPHGNADTHVGGTYHHVPSDDATRSGLQGGRSQPRPPHHLPPPDRVGMLLFFLLLIGGCAAGMRRHRHDLRRRLAAQDGAAPPATGTVVPSVVVHHIHHHHHHEQQLVLDAERKEACERAAIERLRALPCRPWRPESDPVECSLCLTPFEPGTELRELPCGHAFRAACIDAWFASTKYQPRCCPLCKANPLKAPGPPKAFVELSTVSAPLG